MDFNAVEETDALRLTWNLWPNSKIEATRCVIPFAAIYTPNKRLPNMPVVPYEPVPCKQCGGVLNPYASVDYYAKVWVCPFCYCRNHFPAHYQGISEQSVPAELYPQYTTIEYTLPRASPLHPPVYLFVIDTCVAEDELAAAKASVTQALQMMPDYCHVGLITYGTHVHVHELGFAECSKCFVFRGSKEYTSQQVTEQLGLRASAPGARPGAAPGAAPTGPQRQFVLPLSDPACDTAINNILSDLQRDAYPVVSTQRPARCTGTALIVAEALLAASVPAGSCMARVMLFVGGPSTEGPGKVVFGFGPDETAFVRMILYRVPVQDAMVMIQPQLTAYNFSSEDPSGISAEPALLDVLSITPERVLLLDAYFYVVLFHGATVAQWRRAEYHLQPEHKAFAELLAAPQQEAKAIVARRFPVPRVVDCDQNGSQARFLLAKLNPSATYNNSAAVSSEVIMTDDVSLQVFTDHLKRLAVQS
ncbi:hypothetical protein Rsub_11846 [Raphidocelis subcapitata]|uniref:Protein transport protein SEC23 n=1 Tax=Raphidocelis subcapitata TaxID=307507 RepID=A0A2V0PPG6_9CHLO|nr:hypothetical protein Rsub_11846 [Raphidocelis subcapitata]|eukprot:GBF99075.1 hypothetical protein Rsub_11846 [Raphidocelis subcapitata]